MFLFLQGGAGRLGPLVRLDPPERPVQLALSATQDLPGPMVPSGTLVPKDLRASQAQQALQDPSEGRGPRGLRGPWAALEMQVRFWSLKDKYKL